MIFHEDESFSNTQSVIERDREREREMCSQIINSILMKYLSEPFILI